MPKVDSETVIGWGIVRDDPWHFVGMFKSRQEAQHRANDIGDGYVVRYGEREDLLDTFTSLDPEDFPTTAGYIVEPLSPADDQYGRLKAVARWIDGRIDKLRTSSPSSNKRK